jgi:pyruvate dehydrogenase E1 component alpha subunit
VTDDWSADALRWMYRTMVTIRVFEERVAREFRSGAIPGFVHMYIGQEAVATGVCASLGDADLVTSTHRGHGHAIAKGCELDATMAEIYGRETGLCRGRGGSMHLADVERGLLGANAIVGGGIALAAGAALAAQVNGTGQVAVAFFGDGAANQGVLHESLNLAAIWRLPVVFVCENNGYAESTPSSYATSVPEVSARAEGYGIPGVTVGARDVLEVAGAARAAVERARRGDGPTLLEARTHRVRGHFEGDPELYRPVDERGALEANDPIPPFRAHLEGLGVDGAELDAEHEAAVVRVQAAVDFAVASPWPAADGVADHVYAGGAR